MTIDLIEPPPATAIVEYSRTAAALAELKGRLANVFYDLSSTKGMEVAKKDRAELRGLRTALEAKRVELKAPALERSRLIDAEAKALTGELLALEQPIDAQIKEAEAKKAVEKAVREQAEREKTAAVQAKVDEIRHMLVTAAGLPAAAIQALADNLGAVEVSLEAFGDRAGEAAQAKAQTMARLSEMHAAAAAHEAEQVRMAAERAELARLRAEQEVREAAERARIADEQKTEAARLAAERKRLADEEAAAKAARDKADAEARAARDEQDRIAREARHAEDQRQAAARAEIEAKERALREAEEAKAAAARKVEQDRLDAVAKQAREAAAAEHKRLDDEAAARRAEADRIASETRVKAKAAHIFQQILNDAAPAMHDALRQWRAAEETGDGDELQNARAARDEVLALLKGETA